METVDQDIDPIADEIKSIQKEFSEKWNYWMIAKSVAEFTGQTFWQVLESNIIEVLTVATLLKEQVIVEQNKNGRISG